ncbi:MAG TPA: hypothetical protein VFN42_13670, partial [Acetobacteraceae bacterium]|nr:hypothetical protein [Acetobacteraceae bacterium]
MTSSSPNLAEPSGEQVAPGGTVAVPGGYSDSFAQANPGMLYLDITDSSGLLSADDAGGNPVAGSGSSTIALSATYADVNAILGSLHYTAGGSSGSDSIQVQVWNQAGTETTGAVPVTIAAGGGTTDRWNGTVSSDWNNAANWSTGAVPTSGDTVQIYGNNPHDPTLSNATLTGETIDIAGSGNSTPLVTLNNVALNSLVDGSNGARVSIGGTLTIGSQGTLLASSNTFSLSGTAETIVNNGLIASQTNGDMLIYNTHTNNTAAATLTNNGSIAANGGQINLLSDASFPGAPPHWTLLNSGSLTIGNNGGLALNGTVNGGQVAFNGAGTLELQQAQALAGGATLTGFGQGDQIALASGLGTITAFNNGTLDVGTQNGGLTETIPLAGSYTYGNFEQQADTYPNTTSQIVYAAGGSASGQLKTDIVSPASDTVAQGGTLSLVDVSIQTTGTSTNT